MILIPKYNLLPPYLLTQKYILTFNTVEQCLKSIISYLIVNGVIKKYEENIFLLWEIFEGTEHVEKV